MAKYRIVPALQPNTYNIQEKRFLFWFYLAGPYGTVELAQAGLWRIIAHRNKCREEDHRRWTWLRAVPPVYYDKDGKVIDSPSF